MNRDDIKLLEVQGDARAHRARVERANLVTREATERVDVVEDGVRVAGAVVAEKQDPGSGAHRWFTSGRLLDRVHPADAGIFPMPHRKAFVVHGQLRDEATMLFDETRIGQGAIAVALEPLELVGGQVATAERALEPCLL